MSIGIEAVDLEDLRRGLDAVAEGDLNSRVEVRRQDEIGELAAHFNEMTGVLRCRAEEQGRFAAAGQLIAGVAHEVNNPLMAIAALTDSRLEDASLPSELRDDLQQIRRQARRAGKLLSGLLRFVRAGEPVGTALALNDVVQSAVDLVSYRFGVDEITLELRLDPSLPLALGSATRIEQVMVNLLSNGLDALQGTERPRRLTVDTWTGDGKVYASVTDSGEGIVPMMERRLFMPFATTKGADGTGLGLYISRQILRESGGEPQRRRPDELGREIPVARRSPHRRPGAEPGVGVGAVREERCRHLLVAAHDRFVQGGEAGPGGVRVRTFVEQERHEIDKP